MSLETKTYLVEDFNNCEFIVNSFQMYDIIVHFDKGENTEKVLLSDNGLNKLFNNEIQIVEK
jgi:hypothetical protein